MPRSPRRSARCPTSRARAARSRRRIGAKPPTLAVISHDEGDLGVTANRGNVVIPTPTMSSPSSTMSSRFSWSTVTKRSSSSSPRWGCPGTAGRFGPGSCWWKRGKVSPIARLDRADAGLWPRRGARRHSRSPHGRAVACPSVVTEMSPGAGDDVEGSLRPRRCPSCRLVELGADPPLDEGSRTTGSAPPFMAAKCQRTRLRSASRGRVASDRGRRGGR